MQRYQCLVCGWIYDEAEGCEEHCIPPNTLWDDISEEFICPDCGVGKDEFELVRC